MPTEELTKVHAAVAANHRLTGQQTNLLMSWYMATQDFRCGAVLNMGCGGNKNGDQLVVDIDTMSATKPRSLVDSIVYTVPLVNQNVVPTSVYTYRPMTPTSPCGSFAANSDGLAIALKGKKCWSDWIWRRDHNLIFFSHMKQSYMVFKEPYDVEWERDWIVRDHNTWCVANAYRLVEVEA